MVLILFGFLLLVVLVVPVFVQLRMQWWNRLFSVLKREMERRLRWVGDLRVEVETPPQKKHDANSIRLLPVAPNRSNSD